MHYPTFLHTALAGLALLLAGCAVAQPGPGAKTKPKTAVEIISNRAIWGKDFPLALAHLEALGNAGDKTAELFPTALARPSRYAGTEAADPGVRSANSALEGAERLRTFQKVLKNFPFQPQTPKTQLIKAPESDSVLVSLTFGQAELLKPDLRIPTILKELGPAERISYRTIHARGEERPLILTMYSYANGTIVFVESNQGAEPRLLNRVLFDVPNLVNALKTNLK